MEDLRGGTAVITGGGSGIGRGMALTFAAEGMNIVVADIEAGPAEAVALEAKEKGVRAIGVACDVSKAASVEALADRAYAEFGRVNLLCNNAGVLVNKPLADTTDADWQWIFSVNVNGVVYGVRSFLPRMRAQGSPAHIVNTASQAGLASILGGGGGLGVYSASKYAVVAFSETLRHELAEEGIGVSVLCPGGVRTNIGSSARNRPSELGGPAANPARQGPVPGTSPQGLEPLEVGQLVLAAVRANRGYIITQHENRGPILERFSNILESFAFGV